MSTIVDRQNEIVEEFELFDDWMDKYEHIIEFAREVPDIDPSLKIDANLVRGCQSQVWLVADKEGDKLTFQADSDALITKGIVGLLIKIMNNLPAEEIANAELFAPDKIGLKEHLSPNRANGLASMIKTMKAYAKAALN